MPMDMAARAMAKQAEDKAVKQASAKTTATDKRIFPLPNVTDGSLSVDGVKGKTLQNLSIVKTSNNGFYMGNVNGGHYLDYVENATAIHTPTMLIEGKTYTVLYEQFADATVNNGKLWGSIIFFGEGNAVLRDHTFPIGVPTLMTVNNGTKKYTLRGLRSSIGHATTGNGYRFTILEGDWTNKEIPPYFEGIKSVGEDTGKLSVKSTGKNIIQLSKASILGVGRFESTNDQLKITTSGNNTYGVILGDYVLKPNTTYFCSLEVEGDFTEGWGKGWRLLNLSTNIYTDITTRKTMTFTTDANGKYRLLFYVGSPYTSGEAIFIFKNIMVVEGSAQGIYEPYKESKLEIPLTEPLRSLPNGVADEIKDGKIIRRVMKNIYTGANSEAWQKGADDQQTANTNLFYIAIPDKKLGFDNIHADKLITRHVLGAINDVEGIQGNPINSLIYLRLKGQYTLTEFRNWLSANPLTINYEKVQTEQPLTLPSAKSFTNGMVTVENNIWPNEVTVSYSTNVVARIVTSETTLSGVLASTLTLADKELAMKSVTTLATGATLTDAVNKVNQILNIWR